MIDAPQFQSENITLSCDNCGITFERKLSNHLKSKKKNKNSGTCCSHKCAAQYGLRTGKTPNFLVSENSIPIFRNRIIRKDTKNNE